MRRLTPLLFVMLLSCKQDRKFDKVLWDTREDGVWTYREAMLDDLIRNKQLVNLKYSEAVNLLGGSNYSDSSISLSYNIITDYGNDIDPVYSKTLTLEFNKDSVVTSFKVDEWGER